MRVKEKRDCPKCDGTGLVPDDVAIGDRLKSKRLKAGVGLREIARRLNVTAPFVSDLEKGERHWKEWEGRFLKCLKKQEI